MQTTNGAPELPAETTAATVETLESPKKKKRRLSDGQELDQYDCKFGIKIDPEGDVVMMTDESELSSLNSEEAVQLKETWDEYQVSEGFIIVFDV